MSRNIPSQSAQPISDPPIKFYVTKRAIRPMLIAIQGAPPSPFQPQGVPGLQDRDDLSGRFARKVGQNRRALAKADEIIVEERKDLVELHAEKYPADHELAGQPTPVYSIKDDGSPVFKRDAAGNETTERMVRQGEFNVADPDAFRRDFEAMLDEIIVVECPGFTVDDFNKFKSIAPRIVDPLMDLEVDGPTTVNTSDWATPSIVSELKVDEEERAAP